MIVINDILVYSRNKEGHDEHLRMVPQVLKEHKLYANLSKCNFYQCEVHYLGHIISEEGIVEDLEKVEVIKIWTTPKNVVDVRSFMGLDGYY